MGWHDNTWIVVYGLCKHKRSVAKVERRGGKLSQVVWVQSLQPVLNFSISWLSKKEKKRKREQQPRSHLLHVMSASDILIRHCYISNFTKKKKKILISNLKTQHWCYQRPCIALPLVFTGSASRILLPLLSDTGHTYWAVLSLRSQPLVQSLVPGFILFLIY